MSGPITSAYRLTLLIVSTLALVLGAAGGALAQDTGNELSIDGITLSYPSDWIADAHPTYATLTKLPAGADTLPTDASQLVDLPQINISRETRLDHADALRRLRDLSLAAGEAATALEIDGWPAVQVRYLTQRAQASQGEPLGSETVLIVRTAIAADNILLRLEGFLPPDASQALIDETLTIGTSAVFAAHADPSATEQEIQQLQQAISAPTPASADEQEGQLSNDGGLAPLTAEAAAASAGLVVPVSTDNTTDAELEIAVSDNGRDMVIGSNTNWYYSSDGGQTWQLPTNGVNGNDPSLAWGQSGGPQGTFYGANIQIPAAGNGSTILQRSTDGGDNWGAPLTVYTCQQNGDVNCATSIGGQNFPDQEHIAVDRWNVTASGDQVYSAWRHRLSGGWGLVCSTDSGTTWSTNTYVSGGGDLPRITVGQDGFVYVVYLDNAGPNVFNVMLDKFRSCETQTTPFPAMMANEAGFPVKVRANAVNVVCPMPGLNRCNNGNFLMSPTVAVDDTDPSHIYVAHATNTSPGDGTTCANQNTCDEDVVVQDSLDGGLTWPANDPAAICVGGILCSNTLAACSTDADCYDGDRDAVISSGITARRFMPWVCSVGGAAYVSWFDRRNAFPGNATDPISNNSLTDFYGGSAFLDALGALKAGTEFQINELGTADPQCEAGFGVGSGGSWPNGTRATTDSDSCSAQPQNAGFCCVPGEISGGRCQTNTATMSSLNRCDFDNSAGSVPCPAGETCALASGFPKYGDYNGSACGVGRFFATWPSSVAPPSLPAPVDIDTFFAAKVVCCVPQIQVPATANFEASCGAETQTTMLDICNTGKEDLNINSITSDDEQFAVTTPSSGYPVTLSPDFCFPFEATFSPDGGGDSTATLTVNSDDPVNPVVEVDASGSVGAAVVDTFIVDSGEFGNICSGDLKDLNLTVQNNGTCPLQIDAVSLGGLDAADFELPDGALAGTIVEPGNSVLVPVRFAPDNFTDPNPRTAIVEVASRTQGGDTLDPDNTPIEGNVPPPDINVAIANSGDFGEVCTGDHADLTMTLFNQGMCDLEIFSITSDEPQFILPADLQLPLTLSPDADFPLPIRFAPDQCSDTPIEGTITINSDSPGEQSLEIDVSGTAPCPNLVIDPTALEELYAFPTTVVDTTGTLGCYSEKTAVLRNNSVCPLTINDISTAGPDYTVVAPTQFPILLPGGEETLKTTVRFVPQSDADPLAPGQLTDILTVVSDDPDSAHTANLCGESAQQSGVRILVTDISSGDPVSVDEVDSLTIQSKGKGKPGPINLMFSDLAPSAANVCGNTIDYHVNIETLPSTSTSGSNPKSSYQAKAQEGNLQTTDTFTLGQCEFRDAQLQLQDSDSATCLLLEKGAACDLDSECCSGNCKGPDGGKTCK